MILSHFGWLGSPVQRILAHQYFGSRGHDMRRAACDLCQGGCLVVKKVKLGKSNLEVSALAMGSDLIGSKIDRESAFKLFDFYSENGGTFIDTANMYACWLPGCAGGESETTIGAWMKDRRNRGPDRHFLQAGL